VAQDLRRTRQFFAARAVVFHIVLKPMASGPVINVLVNDQALASVQVRGRAAPWRPARGRTFSSDFHIARCVGAASRRRR